MKKYVTFKQKLYIFEPKCKKMYEKNVVSNNFGDIANIDNNNIKG